MTVHEDTLTEGIGVGLTLARMYKGAPTATDTFSVPAFIAATRGFPMTLTDGIGIASSVSILFYSIASVVETLEIEQVEAIGAIYGELLTDEIGVEALQRLGIPTTLTDGIGVEAVQLIAIGQIIAEALNFEPVVVDNRIMGVTLTQGLSLTDLLAQFIAADILETIGVSGALSAVGLYYKTITEGLGIEAVLSPSFLISATCEETIAIEDVDILSMIFNGQLSDGIRITAAYVTPGDGGSSVSGGGHVTTWAVNAATGSVTEYTNYNFNSFAQIGDKYIGASDEGLFELSGADDNGEDIIAAIKSGLIQLVGSRFVGFKAAYLGVRANTTTAPIQFYLKIVTGDGNEHTYKVLAESLRTTKVNIGKGIRTRYWSFELTSFGEDFDLESIEFVPMVAQRRV